jgi:hypothetical protein
MTGEGTLMTMPYASTVIGVLKAAFRLGETCCHLPETSPAPQKLREAVHEVTAELEVIAKKEPSHEAVLPANGNFYKAGWRNEQRTNMQRRFRTLNPRNTVAYRTAQIDQVDMSPVKKRGTLFVSSGEQRFISVGPDPS